MAATLLALSFVLFGVLSALPGDPVDLLVTSNPNVRPDDVQRLKKLRGLDKPWPVRWARWLVGHGEALAPPKPPVRGPVVVELPAEGPAVVKDGDRELRFERPGVYRVPRVVRDAHGLEGVDVTEVLVSPTLSDVPSDDGNDDDVRTLDEAERQLGGSTESGVGVGRASQTQLAEAARKVGPVVALEPPRTFTARDDGAIVVEGKDLSPVAQAESLRFEVVDGPGRFVDGRYTHVFDGPGTTAVVYRAKTLDGRAAEGAFVVEHGLVDDPGRFHRGAIFVLVGDTEALGYSATYKRPVWELLFGPQGRVKNTLLLMGPAILLALLLAVPLGVLAASRRGSVVDRVLVGASTVGLSMPAFWVGLMAMVVFAAKLRWLPAGGIQSPGLDDDLVTVVIDRVRHAILPVGVLGLAYAAPWLRWVRASVLEVLPQDFLRTARAKGLPAGAILRRHALGNALLPLITVVALAAPQLFAGALLTETVFAWPGVGRLQYEAILNNDSYVAIVVFLVSAALVILANLAADLVYLVVDPRLRRGGRRRGEGAGGAR
jgi:peptide/nickel transport system permease protein